MPVFFLCSGALLLDPDRDLSLRKLWGRNILHILLAMWVWAFAYKVYGLLPGGISLAGLWQGAKEVLLFHHEFHLYYLHISGWASASSGPPSRAAGRCRYSPASPGSGP